MIYIVLFLVYVYWVFESVSESYTWMASWHSSKPINPKSYHLIRLPETLSLIISHLILGYLLLGWHGVLIIALAEISACVLYERIYCAMNYGNFFYNKSSKWLGVIHLKAWQELVIFTITFTIMIIGL